MGAPRRRDAFLHLAKPAQGESSQGMVSIQVLATAESARSAQIGFCESVNPIALNIARDGAHRVRR
jgi:hypothetical protein